VTKSFEGDEYFVRQKKFCPRKLVSSSFLLDKSDEIC